MIGRQGGRRLARPGRQPAYANWRNLPQDDTVPSMNGHDRSGPMPAYRLSTEQREKLAAYTSLDPLTLRR